MCEINCARAHPKFRNGGLVAAAFFEHGTRFIDVSNKGKIKEIGWFLPHAGSTGAVYWITDRIAYTLDYKPGHRRHQVHRASSSRLSASRLVVPRTSHRPRRGHEWMAPPRTHASLLTPFRLRGNPEPAFVPNP